MTCLFYLRPNHVWCGVMRPNHVRCGDAMHSESGSDFDLKEFCELKYVLTLPLQMHATALGVRNIYPDPCRSVFFPYPVVWWARMCCVTAAVSLYAFFTL